LRYYRQYHGSLLGVYGWTGRVWNHNLIWDRRRAFCFTVLWTLAGFEVVLGGDFKATGWFSLLGGFFAFFIGLGFFNVFGTALPKLPQFGTWLEIWAVAFWLVFAVFALGKGGLMKLLGWWLIIPTVLFTLVYPVIAFTNFGQVAPW